MNSKMTDNIVFAKNPSRVSLFRKSAGEKSAPRPSVHLSPLAGLAVVLLCCLARGQDVSESPSVDEPGLIIGSTSRVFADVGATDAAAATKVWAEELQRKRGFAGPMETLVLDDIGTVLRFVKAKEVDLLILLTSEYLEIMDEVALEPHFVPLRGATVSDEELLLVHRASGIKTVSELQGKRLLILNDARGSLGRNWLETLTMSAGFPELEDFFGEIRNTSKYSRTVLPVFFRQADACLVPRSGFSTMIELNPQLGSALEALAASPAVVPSVLCIRPDYEPELKQALIEALIGLHEEPRGQQILMMFKVDRLVPFQPAFLETAQELLRRHEAQKKSLQAAGLPAPHEAGRETSATGAGSQ